MDKNRNKLLEKVRKELDLLDEKIVFELAKGKNSKKLEKLIKKRTILYGKKIAKIKLKLNPMLKTAKSAKKIIKLISNKQREQEVIKNAIKTAKKLKMKNTQKITNTFKKIIKENKKTQVKFILKMQ